MSELQAAEEDPLLVLAGVSAGDLRAILRLVADSDVTELDVTFSGGRLTVRRPPSATTHQHPPEADPQLQEPVAITSPLVGIFHPAVSPGAHVDRGQALGAIDSLGIPTNVDAPHGGTVETVLVADNGPVEYGQPLVVLRRSVSP